MGHHGKGKELGVLLVYDHKEEMEGGETNMVIKLA